jgi:hypothetical protein
MPGFFMMMPVIEIIVMQEGSPDQFLFMELQAELFPQPVACSCHVHAVIVGIDPAMLDVFFHLQASGILTDRSDQFREGF